MTSVVVVSAGTSDPSSTRLLGDRIAAQVAGDLGRAGHDASVSVIELAPLAADVTAALLNSGLHSDPLAHAIETLAQADVVVAATPVYKAGVSGLFKSFADVLDNDLLIGKPVVLAATAGSARHAMVVDDQLRPLFAFFRAIAAPTSVFAAPEDWRDPALNRRIERAAVEAVALMGASDAIRANAWGSYRHEFDSKAESAEGAAPGIDFDSPLMRLAAGGSAAPQGAADRD